MTSPGNGGENQFYDVMIDYAVILHADQYFDSLSDSAKYDELEELHQAA